MTGRAKGQRVAGSRVPLRHVEAPAAVAALARAQWWRASSVGGTSWRFAQSRAADALSRGSAGIILAG